MKQQQKNQYRHLHRELPVAATIIGAQLHRRIP
jgi:hypothetical protein